MVIYLVLDDNPSGGYFSAQDTPPHLGSGREARDVSEVRVIEDFPDDLWQFVILGGLPVDPGGSGHDLVWMPWWETAQTVWKRTTESEGETTP